MSAVNVDLGQVLFGVAATTSQNTADFANADAQGVKVFVNITAAGTGSITVAIQAKDPGSGAYVALLTSAALVANAVTMLTVYPGIAVTANVSASDVLPRSWRIAVTANNANPVSYSIGASLIQ